jgi:cytochrome c556
MRTSWGLTVIALMFAVVCAGTTTTAQITGQAGATARAGRAPQARAAAGAAQAAAAEKITVEQHEGYMKTISSTNAAMGKKIMSNELADAAKDAQQIAMVFGDVEKFWTQNNKSDAVMFAQQARMAATDVAGALAAGDTMKAQAARKQMQGSCGGCHMAYREGSPQTGGYTIKAGVVTP